MTDPGDDEDGASQEVTPLSLLMLIKDTYLGKELIGDTPSLAADHCLGEQHSRKLDEGVEGMADEPTIYHAEGCFWSFANGDHVFCRDRPCYCDSALHGHDELLALLPGDKRRVVSVLIQHAANVIEYNHELCTEPGFHAAYMSALFLQKLDYVTWPICRSLVAVATSDRAAMQEVVDIFKAILNSRKEIGTRYGVVGKIAFFQSMFCLAEFHSEHASRLIYNIFGGYDLPNELVDMVCDYYVDGKIGELEQMEEEYFKILRNRIELN